MTIIIPPAVPAGAAQCTFIGFSNPYPEPTKPDCCVPGAELAERAAQADNPSSPAKLLCMLAEDNNLEVRMAVADNPGTPLVALTVLAQDDSDDLRYQLAENHNIDARILELLAADSNPYVMLRAKKTLTRLRRRRASVTRPIFGVWATSGSKTRADI